MIPLLFLVVLVYGEDKLNWSDEFEGTTLNTSKWAYEIDCWGGGNNEKQCYVMDDPQVLNVSDGTLKIMPKYYMSGYKGKLENCTYEGQDKTNQCTNRRDATSARIRTKYSKSWTYGKFEVRAKLPVGNFIWPAIWMLPTNNRYGIWAASGEIDILEYRAQYPNQTEHTLHFGGSWPNQTSLGSGKITHPVDLSQDFHVYSFEWDPLEMRWYIDDTQVWKQDLNRSFWGGKGQDPYNGKFAAPFDTEFHLLINLAIGGNFFSPEVFNAARDVPTWKSPLEIDYVRAYDSNAAPPVPQPAPEPAPQSPVPSPAPTPQVPTVPSVPTPPVPMPVPVDDCKKYIECSTCVVDTNCVWCESSHTCLIGSFMGPSQGICNLGLWSARQCVMTGTLALTVSSIILAILLLILVLIVGAICTCVAKKNQEEPGYSRLREMEDPLVNFGA